MKKRLTETQFRAALKDLDVGQQTIDIARGVLVEGKSQIGFATALGLSKGAVSQAVNRVWTASQVTNIPEGYERVTAVLTEHQAFIVRKWAREATKKLEIKNKTLVGGQKESG
jgi:hypothetical protein